MLVRVVSRSPLAILFGGSYNRRVDREKNISIRIERGVIEEVSRFVKNPGEKKFSLSKPASVLFAYVHDVSFDGATGDLVAKVKVEPHVAREIRNNLGFFPAEIDYADNPELAKLQESKERELYGKSVEETDIAELLSDPRFVQELFKDARPIGELF